MSASVLTSLYAAYTSQWGVKEKANDVYGYFESSYGHLSTGLSRVQRPLEWRILWHIVKYHVNGVCDEKCICLLEKANMDVGNIRRALEWLRKEEFISLASPTSWPWDVDSWFPQYEVTWDIVETCLRVGRPHPAKPLLPSSNES